MKLSNPIAIKWVSLLVSGIIRLWMGTLDIRFGFDDKKCDPPRRKCPALYLCWHEMILFGVYAYVRFGAAALVSRHRDGELVAQIIRMFRGSTIRGSTDAGRNRGGAKALREMMRNARAKHLIVIPDGPRGPRRVVQMGAVYLASRSSMPIIPVGYSPDNPWRLNSWDKMALPRPFSRAVCIFGSPIEIPKCLNRDGLEEYRLRVQTAMDDVQARAERLARGAPADIKLISKHEALQWPE